MLVKLNWMLIKGIIYMNAETATSTAANCMKTNLLVPTPNSFFLQCSRQAVYLSSELFLLYWIFVASFLTFANLLGPEVTST